jgi:release factor glutamine methyltransferase
MTTTSQAPTVAEALRLPDVDAADARILLAHVLGVGHAFLIAHPERPLRADEHSRFLALAARRAHGEPIAYLVGWREFYGRPFRVGPAVLIPRPETELLVAAALARIGPHARVLDLGTGSGNVAISIALERPEAELTAIDASGDALALARVNASALGARNLVLLQGDWFAPLAARRFDAIVSNPPYVAIADPHLQAGDLRFEPMIALRAGSDGLACIRHIVAHAGRHLHAGGWLLFEHGHDQGEACRTLVRAAGYEDVYTEHDLADWPRVTVGRKAKR